MTIAAWITIGVLWLVLTMLVFTRRSPVVIIWGGVGLLMLWIPLRERPGLGTILNALLIGVFVDLTMPVVPDDTHLAIRPRHTARGSPQGRLSRRGRARHGPARRHVDG